MTLSQFGLFAMRRLLATFLVLSLGACAPRQYQEIKDLFLAKEPSFEALKDALLAHPGVRQLTLGSSPTLNERVLLADSLPPDSSGAGRWHLPLHMALAEASLSRQDYDAIVAQMRALGILSAYITPQHLVLVLGGFLDNEYGVLVPREGHSLPALQSEIADAVQLVYLKALRDRWVFFATT